MSSTLQIIDIDDLEASVSASGVHTKVLHEDTATGARCVIAKAPPRAPGPSRPHRHTADEEILNLGPSLRFDDGPWLGKYGYAKYPAGMVHGSAVSLPNGYHLYLRMSGPSQLEFVEGARFKPIDDFVFCPSIQQVRPSSAWDGALSSGFTVRALSYCAQRGIGALLARIERGHMITLPKCKMLELLMLKGQLSAPDGKLLYENNYIRSERRLSLPFTAREDTIVFLHIS